MESRKSYVLVALFALLLLTEIVIAESNGGKDNGNEGDSEAAAKYRVLTPLPSGQEQAMCQARGACYYRTLVCPGECPKRKPMKNKDTKGCFIDCTSKCEATCKWRKTNCNGYGSLCYDPRFIGGDGVMFYFHGSKGGNFAIVSDNNLQINAHFIGTRPLGRTRDFTWVQALNIMFENNNKLVITANRLTQWDEKSDGFTLRYNDKLITLPEDEQTEWRAVSEQNREIVIERTDERNSVRVLVSGLVQMDIRVRPIGKEENRVHNYQLPKNDVFAHLETQFKFFDLSDNVEGVLGKTYRPGYVSSAKTGVPMPVMGGEDKYQTPSLFSPTCRLCMFKSQEEESLSAASI
ncbi:unnamed protein product [Cochlearia groenlandica]